MNRGTWVSMYNWYIFTIVLIWYVRKYIIIQLLWGIQLLLRRRFDGQHDNILVTSKEERCDKKRCYTEKCRAFIAEHNYARSMLLFCILVHLDSGQVGQVAEWRLYLSKKESIRGVKNRIWSSDRSQPFFFFQCSLRLLLKRALKICVVVRQQSHHNGESRSLVAQGTIWKGYMELYGRYMGVE